MMTKKATKPLILIDGSSYLYRAFHALPALANSAGEPTGAVYGVLNMIRKLIADYQPEYIAVIFDAKGKNFRHELYAAYKANRPPMPQELRVQLQSLHQLIKAMGLPLLIVEGVEADDVIATLAKQAEVKGMDVLISTGDKDLAQLVDEKINLINTMSNDYFDIEAVEKKYGVKPEQIIDYLALIGDTSDNVPGVPKVGPKTAAGLLQTYGSLEKIVQHADEIKGKVGENLRNSLEQLPLSKQLIQLKIDVKLDVQPDALTIASADKESLIELLKRLEFKKWLAELLQAEQAEQKSTANYQIILNEKDLNTWIKKLINAKQFAFDLETNSLNTIDAEIVGLSFATCADEAIYIPVAHDYDGAPEQLNRHLVLEKLKPLFANEKLIKLGQNAKFDIEVLANYDITVAGLGFDTMIESYVLNSSSNRHDMDTLALKYLGKKVISFKDVAGSGKKQLTFNQVDLKVAGEYAAEDADIVIQLHVALWPKLKEVEALKKVLLEIEMPLVSVLVQMERDGVAIDEKLLQKQSEKIAKRVGELESDAYQLAKEEFNLNSPKQLQEILFNKLKIPVLKKTPTGQPSTAEEVLQELAFDYPLPKIILEHRTLTKLKSTYTDALPQQVNAKTGRVHTSYNQAVTTTGRLSSTDPNLQNIPVRSEEGRLIRKAFIAPNGKKIISADYSQIELRIMAHLSQDEGLCAAFANGHDIHRATAAEIAGVKQEKVTNEMRRRAKAINFGLIYGMSAFGLAKQIGVSRQEAENYINLYFSRYPRVEEYMENARNKARSDGFVETIFGRRLYTPEINASNFQRRSAAERAAINAPMQGSAADIIKIAMINLSAWINREKAGMKMIMQVHDELVFEVEESAVEAVLPIIKKYMVEAVKLSVPIEVDIGVGNNWDEAH